MDIAGFLADYPPFHGLDEDELARIASAVQVEFFPAGTTILEKSGDPTAFMYVIRKGRAEIIDDGRVLDLIGEGDLFGELSIATGGLPVATVRAAEDLLCYMLPRALVGELLQTASGVRYLADYVRGRLEARAGGEVPDMMATVGAQIRRELVTAPPDSTVSQMAATMTEHHVSSLLIPLEASGWGIVTDRDLRSRVLARGGSLEMSATAVMSSPVFSVRADARVGEVLLSMLEHGIHHVPVTDGTGRFVGMVTDTDLLGLARQSPFALRSTIERAADTAEAVSAARQLPTAVASLVEANVDPVDIGHVVAVTIDALTRRLLDLVIERLGEPPVAWAWLALGSEARREQSLYTDQDHALALDVDPDALADVDPYFADMAHEVTSGLADAGIHRCEGDAMAEVPALRRSLQGWTDSFRGWIEDPGSEGSILSSIAFDYRQIAGPLSAEPALDDVLRTEPAKHPWFAGHLGRRALDLKPPTGFFRDLVVEAKGEHAGRLDIKHGGITIVTNIARVYDVRAGSTQKGTLARLHAAADSRQISEESREGLEEVFRLLWAIRLDHQAQQHAAGTRPDDFVDPTTLGPVRRRALKEAFRIITREQRSLATDLGVLA
jgi:CBS domain-containing protein